MFIRGQIMPSIVKFRSHLYFKLIVALLLSVTLSVVWNHTTHAANDPTYTITPNTKVTAQGGFLSSIDGGSSYALFAKSGDKWIYGGNDGAVAGADYDASKQEVYFNFDTKIQLYVTHVTAYVNQHGTMDGTRPCYIALSVPPGSNSGASIVGVDRQTGKKTDGCTKAATSLLGSSTVFKNVASSEGEKFFDVSIPTCKSATDKSCVTDRKAALAKASAAISCTTTSASGIAECEANKTMLKCLQTAVTNTVSYCQAVQDSSAILKGDTSSITADTTDEYIKTLCKTQSIQENQDKCIKLATAQRDKLKENNNKDESTCGVQGGLGWIICPVVNTLASLTEGLFGFLANDFLKIDADYFKTSSDAGKPVYEAWGRFRDLANVAFVIVFMIIIYSQVTGAGISNYGLKKLLPRLFVVAVLVNVSYWLCAIAVDLSNVVGYSINSFINSAGSGTKISESIDPKASFGLSTLAGGVLAGAVVWLNLAAIIGFLGVAIITLLVIFVILIVRKVAIILLIVLAPLAFVAFLLPNTQSWFDKWRKAFTTLLMIFPIIGLVFGASTLASTILLASAGDDVLLQIIGKSVQILPLIVVPSLIKGSLSTLGAIGNRINGIGDKLGNKTNQKAQSAYKNSALGKLQDYRGEQARIRRAQIQGGHYKGSMKNPLNWARRGQSAVMGKVNNSKKSGAFGDRLGAQGAFLADEEWDKGVNMQKKLYSSQGKTDDQLLDDMNDTKLSKEKRAAAAGMVMEKGSRKSQIEALRRASSLAGSGDSSAGAIQKQMSHDMGTRKPMGLGDAEAANLRNGTYNGNINQSTAERAITHLPAAEMPSADVDDLNLIHSQVQGGAIKGEALTKLQDNIRTAYNDPRISTRISGKRREIYDQIVNHTRADDSQTTHE